MSAELIRVEALHKRYLDAGGTVPVLRGIDLRIARGEFVAVVGPSGSGKSSLLNVLGCLDGFDSGRYRLMGEDVGSLADDVAARFRARHIGFAFQAFHLLDSLSALENVTMPLAYSGRPRAEWRDLGMAALERFGIAALAGRRPNQLSGGQCQRVAIARSLINDPALILADEPTGSLDQASGAQVIELLESLATTGITVVVVTHDPGVARRADRRLQMLDGRLSP